MEKSEKKLLVAAALVVGTYLLYTWYKNKKSANPGFGLTSGAGLGTNLNSVNPFVGSAAGAGSSGLYYYGGTTNVTIVDTIPTPPKPKPPSKTPPPHKGGHLIGGGNPPHVPVPGRHRPGGIIPIPGKPVSTTAATARLVPRSLNTTTTSVSHAVKRTPISSAPKAKIPKVGKKK